MNILNKIVLITVIFTSNFLLADEYRFNLYEDSVQEMQPFELIIEADKGFVNIQKITIREKLKDITFFVIEKKDIIKNTKDGIIQITEKVIDLSPLNEEVYDNYWGDSPISKTHTYGVFIDLKIVNGNFVSGTIDIADQYYDEMAMWGDLVLQ